MHRKALADAIEKARRADPEKEQAKEDADKVKALAAEKRIKNRKEYMDKKLEEKQKINRGEINDEEMFYWEGKSRIINLELTGMNTFAVTSNFLTPDGVISIL